MRTAMPHHLAQTRCRWLGVLCALVAAASATGRAADGRGEDWPQWRGPRGDGTWNGPALPETWPARGVRPLWRRPVGGGDAGVVSADGRVYTLDRQETPEEVERVLCFDSRSGDLLWAHAWPAAYRGLQHGNGPRAAPTLSGGRLYALGALGRLCCLDAVTGRLFWAKDMVGEHGARRPTWGFAASPVVFEGVVIVHTGAEPDGCYIAFECATGAQAWRSVSDPCGYCTPVVIRHADRPLLIAWTPEHVRGIDPRDGRPLWAVPYRVTYGVSIAPPILHEAIVFVSGYWEGAKAIRLGPGETEAALLWEEGERLRGEMSQPLYRDGHVYLLDRSHGLTCFTLRTGEILWTDGHRMTPKSRDPQASLVWLGDSERAIILNAEGDLILARLTPRGYDERSRTRIVGKTWAHPAYAGNHVYARDRRELAGFSLLEPPRD